MEIVKKQTLSETFSVYLDRRMVRILLLGIISGFPWVLIGSSLSLWLKEDGLSRSTIGWAGLIFGVYSYLHSSSLDKILSTNDIHLAYAASLAKHFKNKNVIFAPRKKRILGESQNNYKSLTHYALKIISVFRNQVLINSIVLVFISFLLSKLITSSALFLFILLALLFFNVIIFLLAYQINKSHLVNDTLKNIENIENLRNELL